MNCGYPAYTELFRSGVSTDLHTVQVSEAGFWEEGVWAEFQLLDGAGEVEEDHSPEAPSSRKR